MVRDIVGGMFYMDALERAEIHVPAETRDLLGLTDDEIEEAAPGTREAIRELIAGHMLSAGLYLALKDEVRELARTAVSVMTAEQVRALTEAASRKQPAGFPTGT